MTEFTTSSRGDRVAYDLRGSGPALVFIAGAGPFRAIDPWTTETAEHAAAGGLTTLVWDRLGRGESQADGVLDLDRELEAVRAVLDVVGGSAVLCGHSSGCSIALCATRAGLGVDGLALWEAPLVKAAAETRAWAAGFEERVDAGDNEVATAWYMQDMPPEFLAGIRSSPEWPLIAAGAVNKRADAQSLVIAQAALDDGSLAELDVPVLAVYGTRTFPGMAEAADRIAATVPGAVSKAVPGANHAWEPEPMAAELVTFVTGLAH